MSALGWFALAGCLIFLTFLAWVVVHGGTRDPLDLDVEDHRHRGTKPGDL